MIHKKVLSNGLVVLVRQTTMIPQVSIQLFYNVGSKHESSKQKGIAHLIEHMIFKGTTTLSESDINAIVHKLSGYCNAFTSYDYTGYMFDFPSAHWHEALVLMADCMRNCTFKQELLNSEMKAVIQELKMYNDNYNATLMEKMVSTIFIQHPYHYPIIGFKDNLWSMKQADLLEFYHKHYVPNNATLVIVGDVSPEEAFKQAENNFGSIQSNPAYQSESFHSSSDISATSINIYRDVQQSQYAFAFLLPGAREKMDAHLDIITSLLGGKTSSLYKKLIDELQLISSMEVAIEDLFDHSILFIEVQPYKTVDISTIREIITEQIHLMIKNGISDEQLLRAQKQAESNFLSLVESNQHLAYYIGKSYLATQDHEYFFNYINILRSITPDQIIQLLKKYCRPSALHSGAIMPLSEQEKIEWYALQEKIDRHDAKILKSIERNESIEQAQHVHTISKKRSAQFSFPKPTKIMLPNGLTILYYHNPTIDKIDIALSLKAKSYYDPDNQQGLYSFIAHMLLEGTKHYTKEQLAAFLEDHGMNIEINPGLFALDCLSSDLPDALTFLQEILCNAIFPSQSIPKIRSTLLSKLSLFWDDPNQFVKYLARKHIYHQHPYSKLALGTQESLSTINQQDLLSAYQEWFTPDQATLVIVGNIKNHDIEQLTNTILGSWKSQTIKTPSFPLINQRDNKKPMHHSINRDQITLALAGHSISRKDPRFDALLILDQVLTGGPIGSMNSRLFSLREQSGLFYSIGGSLLYNTDEQPGMIYISTMVSSDRIHEAEKSITHLLDSTVQTLNETEIEEAQDMLAQAIINNFETNKSIAQSFLFLEKYKLPLNYFDTRAEQLRAITRDTIQQKTNDFLSSSKLITIKAGRLE